jgi:5'/3'-nucleotidase SurE
MQADRPLILVTNDDGVTAKGIRSLVKAVADLGEVVVVAPDSPQSGMGHAVTINNVLRIHKLKTPLEGSEETYSTTGTPVDCVKLAIYHVLEGRTPDLLVRVRPPDLPVSGFAACAPAFHHPSYRSLSFSMFFPPPCLFPLPFLLLF